MIRITDSEWNPGYLTNVEIDLDEATFDRLLAKLAPDAQPDWGYAAGEFHFGPHCQYAALVLVLGKERRCVIEVANTPEGDERLDGGSPEWRNARSTLWVDMVPACRAILKGELPPYPLTRLAN